MIAENDWSQLADDLARAELWQWTVALGSLAGAAALGGVLAASLHRAGRSLRDREGPVPKAYPLLGILLHALGSPLFLFMISAALYVGTLALTNWEWPEHALMKAWRDIIYVLASLSAAWFLHRMVAVVDYALVRRTRRAQKALNPQIVPLVRRTLQTLVVVVALLFIAQNILHWEIGAMLTALGIGGLAIALAAQPTLSNLFGSVTIFADRPFQLGDTVKLRGFVGVVQDVGFRSTRIRTPEGTIVTIPNASVANEPVETLGHCPGLRQDFTVIIKNAPADPKGSAVLAAQAVRIVQGVLDERKASLLDHPQPRVALSAVTAATLTLSVSYWFGALDYEQSIHFHQEILLETLSRLSQANMELA